MMVTTIFTTIKEIIVMLPKATKRLLPEERSAEILSAAKRLLDRVGVRGFSLEAVAREAGVAASLPRHYFGGSIELLSAATLDVLKEVERAVRSPDESLTLAVRFSTYLDVIQKHPWGHSVWMRSAELHPSIDTLVRNGRIRLGEAIFHKSWRKISKQEQIHARGCVGFVEAVVSDWIERDFADRALVIEALLRGIQSFQTDDISGKQESVKIKKKAVSSGGTNVRPSMRKRPSGGRSAGHH